MIPEEREGEVKAQTGGAGYVCEETPRATAEEGKSKVYLCRYSSRKTFSWGIIKTTQVIDLSHLTPAAPSQSISLISPALLLDTLSSLVGVPLLSPSIPRAAGMGFCAPKLQDSGPALNILIS